MGLKLLKTSISTTGLEVSTKQDLITKFPSPSYTIPQSLTPARPSNKRGSSVHTSIASVDDSYLFFPYTPDHTLTGLTYLGPYATTSAANVNTDYGYLFIFNSHPITGLPDTQIANLLFTYLTTGARNLTGGWYKTNVSQVSVTSLNFVGGRKYWFGLFRKGTASALGYLPTTSPQDYIGFTTGGTFGLCYSATASLNRDIDKMSDLGVSITLVNHAIPWLLFQDVFTT